MDRAACGHRQRRFAVSLVRFNGASNPDPVTDNKGNCGIACAAERRPAGAASPLRHLVVCSHRQERPIAGPPSGAGQPPPDGDLAQPKKKKEKHHRGRNDSSSTSVRAVDAAGLGANGGLGAVAAADRLGARPQQCQYIPSNGRMARRRESTRLARLTSPSASRPDAPLPRCPPRRPHRHCPPRRPHPRCHSNAPPLTRAEKWSAGRLDREELCALWGPTHLDWRTAVLLLVAAREAPWVTVAETRCAVAPSPPSPLPSTPARVAAPHTRGHQKKKNGTRTQNVDRGPSTTNGRRRKTKPPASKQPRKGRHQTPPPSPPPDDRRRPPCGTLLLAFVHER